MNNNNSEQRIVTKSHLRFIWLINIVLLITVGVLIYELTQKDSNYYLYIFLGISFVLKGISVTATKHAVCQAFVVMQEGL